MSKLIPLTQGKFVIVDDADYDWLNQWKWCASYDKKLNRWVAIRNCRCIGDGIKRMIRMSRQIMSCPCGLLVDHRNHDALDNRRHNLRICTKAENNCNRIKLRRNCCSRFKGVTQHKGDKKWHAYIKFNRKQINLGYYNNEMDAARVYDKTAKKMFGEFAYLNGV